MFLGSLPRSYIRLLLSFADEVLVVWIWMWTSGTWAAAYGTPPPNRQTTNPNHQEGRYPWIWCQSSAVTPAQYH